MAKQTIIRPFDGFQDNFVRSNLDLVIGGGSMSAGKAQPLDSLVCTPFGFRKMGDLKVGDIISNTKGGMQKVIQVFDRGELPVVEFTFDDGRIVKCTYDHLWKARRVMRHPKRYRLHGCDKDNLWEIMTTEQILKIMNKKSLNRVCIPLCEPIQFTRDNRTQGLTIHPYVLGCLLGDGCITGSTGSISFYTSDDCVAERIRSFGYDIQKKDYSKFLFVIHDTNVKKTLIQKKLWGKRSFEKFIPNVYKHATIEDRIELLRGLFDTDGYANKHTSLSFDVTSKQLAEDVQWIIRSLGGYASISTKQGEYRNDEGEIVECKTVYKVYINIGMAQDLFTLDRKKSKLSGEHKYGACEEIGIASYRILPSVPMRCIRVSNPNSLYITNDFVVTHNTASAVLMCAEPSLDGRFRACFLRNNLGDLKSGGGVLDEFKKMYGEGCSIVESGDPHVDFPSGARIDVTHIADQSLAKISQRFKGRQYDCIYFDEGTGFTWECFSYLFSRNRGIAKWTGKMRMTTNPERDHWLRIFLDWYIGADGFIIPERNGVVRYFYVYGKTVKEVAQGCTKEEVYAQCKTQIDRVLAKFNGKHGTATYLDMIKSFTFYEGKTSENRAILDKNSGYVGSIAVMGETESQKNLEGNWNVSSYEGSDNPIEYENAYRISTNDPQKNNDRWITCDLADAGEDNFLAIAWDGFHIKDILILTDTTPRMNAERLELFAIKHDVANSHIIYDAIRGTYINDYIPDAQPYMSNHTPIGVYSRMCYNLKTEVFLRLVEAINNGYFSMDEEVANRVYEHKRLRTPISILNEFVEECMVVRFKELPSGKKQLLPKKEMNAKLGKNRSMDLLDPCAMRFLPCLEFPYGEELTKSAPQMDDIYEDDVYGSSIYDETLYG